MSKHLASRRPERYEGRRKAARPPLLCRLGLHVAPPSWDGPALPCGRCGAVSG